MSGSPSWFDRGTLGGGDQLLGEERVAVGSPCDGVDQGRPQLVAGDHADHLDELVAVEPGQIDPVDPRLAFGLGQPAGQRMTAVQLVAAEGGDDEQALVPPRAREEGQQVAGRAVGPVRVFDDEQDRVRVGETAEEPEDALEDPDLEPIRLARLDRAGVGHGRQLGNEPRQLGQAGPGGRRDPLGLDPARQGTQGLDDRAERQSVVADGYRAAHEDEPAPVAHPTGELRHQPALADARLAADERDGGLPGRDEVGRGEERLELARATDEHRAGQAPSHGRHHTAPFGANETALLASPVASRAVGVCGESQWREEPATGEVPPNAPR